MTPLLVHRQKSVDRAFERLYKRHVHDVYRYTLAVLHNEADAEDVTQATFLGAYGAFRKGERPVKPHNWLIKIAHNECRQRFRASARRPQEVALQETDGHASSNPDEDVPTAEELRHALAQLSFNQRAALVMRELEGRTYAEIAAILETSVSAVETLLFRARRALREQLDGSLTCGQAELTLARRLEGSITQTERGALRAHLRECRECAALERRQRAHRTALKTSLGAVPLPASLQSFFGGSAATVGGAAVAGSGVAAKAVAVVAAGAVAVGAGQAVQAVTAKPDTRKAEHRLDNSRPAATAFSPVARVQRAASSGRRTASTPTVARRTVAARRDAGATGGAHRRSLRPSEVETSEGAVAPTQPAAGSAARTTTPPNSPVPQPPAVPPPPVPLPVPLPPPPPVELPKLPLPPPPPPPPIELPKLPPPPPVPPLPPLPPPLPLPPPPPLPIPK